MPKAGAAVCILIPAFDEEGAIGAVVSGFAALGAESLVDEIVVVDNRSTDRTAERAASAGASVVREERPGYGSACLAGMAYLRGRARGPPAVLVFADGDGSNDPGDLPALVEPIAAGEVDLVIGARRRRADPGSLGIAQRIGNILAAGLLRALHGMYYTDLGPYRAIAWGALERIGMRDPDYGWTVEMQVKAAKAGLRVREIDVRNHARIAGRSKVSGTLRGVVGAGAKIIGTILRYR